MGATMRNIGAFIKGKVCQFATATAGSTGDSTEVNGEWIDRQGYMSAKLVIAYKATLTATKTLSITANLQDATAADGTGADDFGDALATTVVATGGDGGSTEIGEVELDFDLSGANQYVRAQFTPDLSADNSDTAILSAVLILGGAQVLPAA